ncbi:hypothetical protein [Streptomyces katrae]|uniref:hypothetical protein n=1 Tax=Streptomyces katrae TaxID=68223 RepID=UPI0004C211F6|nr:hypothetical protein [Streptomyces katrae]
MTWRELASYVQGLPPHARVRTALREGREEPTGEQVLLADVFDMLQRVNWTLQAVNTPKESKQPKPPKAYPRWWLQGKTGTPRDTAARLARMEAARERARERKRQLSASA